MIAMKFTIELVIGFSFLLQAARPQLGPITRRKLIVWAVQAIVRPLPTPH